MDEVRSQYLFVLAHVCHMPPSEVDETAFVEMLSLGISAEEWLKEGGGLV